MLADQFEIEGALAISGYLYRQVATVVLERLGGLAALASCRGSCRIKHVVLRKTMRGV